MAARPGPRLGGSIPAWAGKPGDRGCGSRTREVYPRVGGETDLLPLVLAYTMGLSPRGRGNLCEIGVHNLARGSIPAWAGKPMASTSTTRTIWVYPRVGGETIGRCDYWFANEGLSPRGRGNRRDHRSDGRLCGSIPAWAGKPYAILCPLRCRRVYPRVGGETLTSRNSWSSPAGLSPRGRGNRLVRTSS